MTKRPPGLVRRFISLIKSIGSDTWLIQQSFTNLATRTKGVMHKRGQVLHCNIGQLHCPINVALQDLTHRLAPNLPVHAAPLIRWLRVFRGRRVVKGRGPLRGWPEGPPLTTLRPRKGSLASGQWRFPPAFDKCAYTGNSLPKGRMSPSPLERTAVRIAWAGRPAPIRRWRWAGFYSMLDGEMLVRNRAVPDFVGALSRTYPTAVRRERVRPSNGRA